MRTGKWTSLLALLLALSLVAAACGGNGDDGDGGDAGEPVVGGTLVFGAEQEPTEGFAYELACCTLFWASVILAETLEGAYEQTKEFDYEPVLVESVDVEEDPFALTYHIRPEAQWNDETPITSADFVFTAEIYQDPDIPWASTAGYDVMDVKQTEVIDDKTVKFVFTEPYAAWKEIFAVVYPEHALKGENLQKAWSKEIVNPKTGEPIASGAFQFESYNPGADLTIARNENFWGEHTAYLDEIVFRFLPETNTEIQALRGGEVDAIYPQPQRELSQLVGLPEIEIQSNAGTTWEHIDIQNGPDGNALLQEQFVREAIIQGIDRAGLVTHLFSEISPDLTEPLQNIMYVSNQGEYEDHWSQWGFDPDAARATLEDNGCTLGGDDIYVCDGEKLSFRFTSTTGNALREEAFEFIQAQLKDVGIEVKNDFGEAGVVFGSKVLVAGNYDLFMFAWVGSPDPAGYVEIWGCEGGQNFHNFCDEDATDLLDETDRTLDSAARADLFNQADELMAQQVGGTIPLYQKPTFFAYNVKLQNAEDNATEEGPTWNAGEWWIAP